MAKPKWQPRVNLSTGTPQSWTLEAPGLRVHIFTSSSETWYLSVYELDIRDQPLQVSDAERAKTKALAYVHRLLRQHIKNLPEQADSIKVPPTSVRAQVLRVTK